MWSTPKGMGIEPDRTPKTAEIVIRSAFFEYSGMKTRLTIVSC